MTKRDNLGGGRLCLRRSGATVRRSVVLGCFVLAGCAVGPDFVKPTLPAVASFSHRPLPLVTASAPVAEGGAQRFEVEQAIKADWWTLFQSPALDALIDKAFRANPTIEAATEALRMAQENVYAQQGLFFPTLQGSYGAARTKVAANPGGASPDNPASIYTLHTAQLTVGFTPDLFGANRRQVETLEAQAQFEAWQLEAAYTTLATNVVAAAIQEALLREQIAIARETIDAAQRSVDLVGRQLKAGFASRLDLTLQQNALIQDQQLLTPLNRQLEQTRNLLRALTGAMPDTELPARFDLASLRLPLELPLSLPSQVVTQRPDIRAAEELLHAATAQVGVAKANRLPKFSIDGTGGGAGRFIDMFSNAGTFFNLAGTVAQPLLDGGVLKHRQRAAEEALRQADAQYRLALITAFQNVADTLYALHGDAEMLATAVQGERTAGAAVELIRRQLLGGYVDRLALINAEQNHRQAALSLAQARAARLADTAALFQALGGGWWHATVKSTDRAN